MAEEGLALARALGDAPGMARALGQLGRVAGFVRHEHARARVLLEESLALCQELDNHWYRAWSHLVLADVVAVQGEFVQARAQYEAAIALWRELGDKEVVAIALTALADFLSTFQKDVGTAHTMSEEALLLTRELGSQQETQPLTVLAEIALSQGDLAAARQLAEELLIHSRSWRGSRRARAITRGRATAMTNCCPSPGR